MGEVKVRVKVRGEESFSRVDETEERTIRIKRTRTI